MGGRSAMSEYGARECFFVAMDDVGVDTIARSPHRVESPEFLAFTAEIRKVLSGQLHLAGIGAYGLTRAPGPEQSTLSPAGSGGRCQQALPNGARGSPCLSRDPPEPPGKLATFPSRARWVSPSPTGRNGASLAASPRSGTRDADQSEVCERSGVGSTVPVGFEVREAHRDPRRFLFCNSASRKPDECTIARAEVAAEPSDAGASSVTEPGCTSSPGSGRSGARASRRWRTGTESAMIRADWRQ